MIACGGRTPLDSEPLGTGARAGAGGSNVGGGNNGAGNNGGSSVGRSDAMPPEPDAGPVNGNVVDAEGRAYPGVELRLGRATAITDIDGQFAFAGAPATYEVSTVLYQRGVYVFSGLARRDPTLRIFDRFSLENPSRHARATVTMPTADTDTIKAVAFFEVTDTVDFNSYNADTMGSSTHFHAFWAGPKTLGIRLHAFRYAVDPLTVVPKQILAYDTDDRRLSEEDSLDWTPAWKAMPFAESTIAAKASLPTGYVVDGARLFIRPSAQSRPFVLSESRDTAPFVSFVVPDMPGATFELEISAKGPTSSSSRRATGLTPGSPEPLLELEPSPISIAPEDGATGVGAGTTLRWTNPTARAAFARLFFDGSVDAGYPIYCLVTGADSVAIPDVSNRGVTLPSGVKGNWAVFGTSAVTADDLAAYGTAHSDLPQRTYASSNYRSFTAQ